MRKDNKTMQAPAITFTRMETKEPKLKISLEKYTSSTLIACLQKAIDLEEYEEAVIYRNELSKRVF